LYAGENNFYLANICNYELEVEGSPNSSYMASDKEGTQEAYADDPLADEEWLVLYERDRKEEEALQLCCLKHNEHALLEKRKRRFRPS